MLLLAFRSFFFIAVILGYSTGIWRLINDYFRREFQTYLAEQAQTNKYLLRDPPDDTKAAPSPLAPEERNPDRKWSGVVVPDNQQLLRDDGPVDSIRALFEQTAGTGSEGTVVADDGKREVVVAVVVAAAEASDIRVVDDGGGTEEAAEDNWVTYWTNRGDGAGRAEDPDGGFCRISPPSAEVFSGCD